MFKKIKFWFRHIYYKWFKHRAEKKLSKGEAFVKAWLTFNNLKFSQQYLVDVPTSIRPSGVCYIDFMVSRNKKKYAIEYNGKQHYFYTRKFHKSKEDFIKQQRRDKYIQAWCIANNVTYIEVPYTHDSSAIDSLLRKLMDL